MRVSDHGLAPEGGDEPICQKCADIGEKGHVSELDGGPFPASGLAAHDGAGGQALHGEGEEDQQRDGSAESQVAPERLLQADVAGGAVDSVDCA